MVIKEVNSTKLEESLKTQVTQLYDMMKQENLEELEIRDADSYLYIKRKGKNIPVSSAVSQQQYIPNTVKPAEIQDQSVVPAQEGTTVKSPIIGVFYQAPTPTSPQFVKEGDIVSVGKTLCIVEAMKVMNEIKADSRMKILKILVENGKPIVSGQDLFLVEKA